MKQRTSVHSRACLASLALCGFAALPFHCLHAQGILTVTPGRAISTTAGTGAIGYGGDGVASSAALASPSAIAYDSFGNFYLADARNHVVREIDTAGIITTVAGNGVASFGGDNGPATSAFLDTPTGVAIDSAGNLYIADSHNHRIRKVASGIITTIAGNGVPGYSGDAGPATSASLFLPSALAIDSSNTLYIADTNNQRIRKVADGVISTAAGNGEELYAGDGGSAIAASLDLPTGVAVDTAGRVYIADRHNNRIRQIDAAGVISTVAGTGPISFAGDFSGEGASPTASALAKPTGVTLDDSGNLFIADSNNQRIRQIANGIIATIAGTGEQGFGGNNGPLTSAILDSPRAILFDGTGTLLIADTLNQRLRAAPLPTLAFSSVAVGTASLPQAITLANTGTMAITLSLISFTGPFLAADGGTCTARVTLTPGADCSQNISYLPVVSTASKGSVTVGGPGVLPASILLTGGASPGPSATTLLLAGSIATPLVGQPITFTATLEHIGAAVPTGSVVFYDGSTILTPAQSVSSTGTASITIATLTAGVHTISAAYSGDASFAASTSSAFTQNIADFTFSLGSTTAPTQTVVPGQPATFGFVVQPISGTFSFPVVLSATGLPPGATVQFTPATISLGAFPASFQMTIQTAASTALLLRPAALGGATALALLLLPFSTGFRKRTRGSRHLLLGIALLLGAGGTGTMTGCGKGNGFFGQSQKIYTIDVIATSVGTGGATLQHVAFITLTIQ